MTAVQTWHFAHEDICRCGHHKWHAHANRGTGMAHCEGHLPNGDLCPCEAFRPGACDDCGHPAADHAVLVSKVGGDMWTWCSHPATDDGTECSTVGGPCASKTVRAPT